MMYALHLSKYNCERNQYNIFLNPTLGNLILQLRKAFLDGTTVVISKIPVFQILIRSELL